MSSKWKELRQRLRKPQTLREKLTKLNLAGWVRRTLYVGFIWSFQLVLMHAGNDAAGSRGVLLALTLVGSLFGLLTAFVLKPLTVPPWQLLFFPADRRTLTRFRPSRAPLLGWLIFVPIGGSIGIAMITHWMPPFVAAGWATGAVALGVLFGSTRFSLVPGGVAALFMVLPPLLLARWLPFPGAGYFERMLLWSDTAWPPAWAVSGFISGDLTKYFIAGSALAAVLLLVIVDRKNFCPDDEEEIRNFGDGFLGSGLPQDEEEDDDFPPPERLSFRKPEHPIAADQKATVRQSVAHGWIGLAAYVDMEKPSEWPDRLLWRALTIRQRLLACPGGGDSSGWIKGIRWALLGALTALVCTGCLRYLNPSHWPTLFLGVGVIIGLLVSTAFMWPSQSSVFRGWISACQIGSIGQVPAFLVFPITLSELCGALAKEWFIRSIVTIPFWWVVLSILGWGAFGLEELKTSAPRIVLIPLGASLVLFPCDLQFRLSTLIKSRWGWQGAVSIVCFLFGLSGILATCVLTSGNHLIGSAVAFSLAVLLLYAGLKVEVLRHNSRHTDPR
jgi:hypothetical protein